MSSKVKMPESWFPVSRSSFGDGSVGCDEESSCAGSALVDGADSVILYTCASAFEFFQNEKVGIVEMNDWGQGLSFVR